MNLPELNSVLLVLLLAGLGMLGWWYKVKRGETVNAEAAETSRRESIASRLTKIEEDMRALNFTVQPITTAMTAVLVQRLTHLHELETDALLAKVGPPNTLTINEEAKLAELLKERTHDMAPHISDLERNAAQMLPLVIERSRLEGSAKEGNTELALVSVPKAHE
jgi:hypothetical protein